MYYSSNENYMQDLYTYNQNPINTYNPYLGNTAGINQMGFGINQNNNMFRNPNMNQNANISSLFPSVYRIINPVVNRVVSSTNTSYLTEDILNNMTDTVYNIVEGQIEADDLINQNQIASNQNSNSDSILRETNNTNRNISNGNSNNSNTSNGLRNSNDIVNRSNISSNSGSSNLNISNQNTNSRRHHNHDMLLKDLIKILILKQILSKGNSLPNPYHFNYQNQFMANQNYMNPNNFNNIGFYN